MIARNTMAPRATVTVSAITLSMTAAAALGFGATSAWGANSLTDAAPEAYLQVFSEPASAEDELPAEGEGVPYAEGAGLRYDTSRALGSDATARYWVVESEQSQICLVSMLLTSGDSSMVCVAGEKFAKEGVSGAVASFGASGEERGYTEAYLVPDALRFVTVPDGLGLVTSYLATGDTRGRGGALTSTTTDGQARMNVQLLHPDRSS